MDRAVFAFDLAGAGEFAGREAEARAAASSCELPNFGDRCPRCPTPFFQYSSQVQLDDN